MIIRQWIVDCLAVGAMDMDNGFPIIKQMHSNSAKGLKRFSNMLNNQATFTDATVMVAGQAIHVHKLSSKIDAKC